MATSSSTEMFNKDTTFGDIHAGGVESRKSRFGITVPQYQNAHEVEFLPPGSLPLSASRREYEQRAMNADVYGKMDTQWTQTRTAIGQNDRSASDYRDQQSVISAGQGDTILPEYLSLREGNSFAYLDSNVPTKGAITGHSTGGRPDMFNLRENFDNRYDVHTKADVEARVPPTYHDTPSSINSGLYHTNDFSASQTAHMNENGVSRKSVVSGRQHLRPDVTPFSPGQATAITDSRVNGAHWSSGTTTGQIDWSAPVVHKSASPLAVDFLGAGDLSSGQASQYGAVVSPLAPLNLQDQWGNVPGISHMASGTGATRPSSSDLVDFNRSDAATSQWNDSTVTGSLASGSGVSGNLDGLRTVPGQKVTGKGTHEKVKPVGPFGTEVWSQPTVAAEVEAADGYDEGDDKFYDALLNDFE